MTTTALSLLAGAIVTVGLLVIVAAFRPAQALTWLPLWRWCWVAPQASPRTSTRPGSGG